MESLYLVNPDKMVVPSRPHESTSNLQRNLSGRSSCETIIDDARGDRRIVYSPGRSGNLTNPVGHIRISFPGFEDKTWAGTGFVWDTSGSYLVVISAAHNFIDVGQVCR